MSEPAVVALIALALGVIAVRRRSVAIVLVSLQSLVLGVGAIGLAGDRSADFLVASLILTVKAGALPALLVYTRHRTPEPRLVAAAAPMLGRVVGCAAIALVASAVMPPLGLEEPAVERGALVLVALGVATVVVRRPALFQALGLLMAENGIYLLAISAPGGMSFVIDLGVLFDLMLVLTVAIAFTRRIHGEFGTGDTEFLRGLRD